MDDQFELTTIKIDDKITEQKIRRSRSKVVKGGRIYSRSFNAGISMGYIG
jgi:hypothetical protein